jgi:hypothetical protein
MRIVQIRKRALVICFSFLCTQFVNAQLSISDSISKMQLLRDVKTFGTCDFGMSIKDDFYTEWALSENPNLYVYISYPKIIKSPYLFNIFFYFRFDELAALNKIRKNDSLGYSTLLYKTYGTSGTKLSKHLLGYSRESVSFIGFHEATHLHLSRNASIPYIFNEALCDVIGIYGSLSLAKSSYPSTYLETQFFSLQLEDIIEQINQCILTTEASDTVNQESARSKLRSTISSLNPKKHQFLIERYDYPINNAYLLRNMDYTKYYFKLKKLLYLTDEVTVFFRFISTLPKDELASLAAIDNEILRLTSRKN